MSSLNSIPTEELWRLIGIPRGPALIDVRAGDRDHPRACVLLGRIAIGDWLTALIGLASLAVLFRWKVSNPMLIGATAARWTDRFSGSSTDLGHGEIAWD
jgi:hypothetical protein